MEPTNNEPRTRTMNKDAVAGSVNDTYRYNPWRAPGFAPVFDACGMAGGTPPGNAGPGEAVFSKTPWAEMGDKGSEVLKPGEVSAEWSAGTEVEVAWGIRYNHGGGYQYRLCPASEPLTEDCFQKMPLAFSKITKPSLKYTDGTSNSYEAIFCCTRHALRLWHPTAVAMPCPISHSLSLPLVRARFLSPSPSLSLSTTMNLYFSFMYFLESHAHAVRSNC